MLNDISWQTIFAGVAAIVAIFSLFLTFREKKRQHHDAIIRSFQGDKEAVAYIAFQIYSQAWGRKKKERKELITALGMAWIFERSDRARAMIHVALEHICENQKHEVKIILNEISKKLKNYVEKHYVDPNMRKKRVGKYQERLNSLKKALKLIDTIS